MGNVFPRREDDEDYEDLEDVPKKSVKKRATTYNNNLEDEDEIASFPKPKSKTIKRRESKNKTKGNRKRTKEF